MGESNQLKNQHLLWRAGFGPMAEDFLQVITATSSSYIAALFKASSKIPDSIDVADNSIKGLVMGIEEVGMQQKQQLSSEKRKKIREQSRDDIKSLNLAWLHQMINSPQQLREKVALFWHGHFASRNLNILYQQQLLDIIRKHALGNFGELLTEVSKSAAMINFLNNNQNKKNHPNENFAREVMELFTLGRGNYSENDIKEAARAFTGWGATVGGQFVFRKQQHDAGYKTVLGKSGNLQGEDVLQILLEQKQTAVFIVRKVYKFFVNEQVDDEKVSRLAERFFQSNYDIAALFKDIFNSDWFYDSKNIGSKIKSPVELIVGIQRAIPMQLENPEAQLLLQRLLGQLLFYPPNVAGWPGGKNWIDSSSLMLRMRIPNLIYSNDDFNIKPKDDDDQMMGMQEKKNIAKNKQGLKLIAAKIDWELYLKKYDGVPREKLLQTIAGKILQTKAGVQEETMNRFLDASSRESFIKTATIQLMSTPEYQLC